MLVLVFSFAADITDKRGINQFLLKSVVIQIWQVSFSELSSVRQTVDERMLHLTFTFSTLFLLKDPSQGLLYTNKVSRVESKEGH